MTAATHHIRPRTPKFTRHAALMLGLEEAARRVEKAAWDLTGVVGFGGDTTKAALKLTDELEMLSKLRALLAEMAEETP